MTGAIRGGDVMLHPLLIVRGFGLAVFGRCVWNLLLQRRTTFLSALKPAGMEPGTWRVRRRRSVVTNVLTEARR